MNKLLLDTERLLFMVAKEDIVNNSYNYLIDVFKRLEDSPELILHLKNKVDISIHGYDEDPRELFEIKEVMRWAKKIFPKISGLAYFLNKEIDVAQFLKVAFTANVQFKLIERDFAAGKNYIEYDTESSIKFINKLFKNLNDFKTSIILVMKQMKLYQVKYSISFQMDNLKSIETNKL